MDDEYYMQIALKEANKSLKYNDVPVGAVIVCNDKIVSKAFNMRKKHKSTLAHAEILAIKKANKKLKCEHLSCATLYTTFEPCLMCMGAILSARIDRVVYGARDKRFGTGHLATNNNFNYKCNCDGGVLEDECSKLISQFFKKLRSKNESSRKATNKRKHITKSDI